LGIGGAGGFLGSFEDLVFNEDRAIYAKSKRERV
jgi:hypothetical protein